VRKTAIHVGSVSGKVTGGCELILNFFGAYRKGRQTSAKPSQRIPARCGRLPPFANPMPRADAGGPSSAVNFRGANSPFETCSVATVFCSDSVLSAGPLSSSSIDSSSDFFVIVAPVATSVVPERWFRSRNGRRRRSPPEQLVPRFDGPDRRFAESDLAEYGFARTKRIFSR